MTVYGKLIRDRIPEIITTNGEVGFTEEQVAEAAAAKRKSPRRFHPTPLAGRGEPDLVDHFMVTTILPFARPLSPYARASLVASKGKTRSTTGRITPESTSEARPVS